MRSIRLILLVLSAACLVNCHRHNVSIQDGKTDTIVLVDSTASIKFIKPVAYAGKIMSGEKVGMDFVFYNQGRQSLIILDARAACGCTVPEWSKIPVQPGGKGIIRVIYDSSGETGMQNKSIRILSNARNSETDLIITAEVIN